MNTKQNKNWFRYSNTYLGLKHYFRQIYLPSVINTLDYFSGFWKKIPSNAVHILLLLYLVPYISFQ